MENEEAMALFDGAGAVIDPKKKVARLPPYLVEDCIRSAPSTFVAAGRVPDSDIVLEDNRVSFTNFGEGIQFVDEVTGKHRQTTKADIEKAALIIDSLEHVETYERAMLSHD